MPRKTKKPTVVTGGSPFRKGYVALPDLLANAKALDMGREIISQLMGCKEDTLLKYLRTDDDMKQALEEGESRATYEIVRRMYQEAYGGRVWSKIVIKETDKGGWEKTTTVGVTQPNTTLMMFIATNRDNKHWKHVKQVVKDVTENRRYSYELPTGDKVAQLAGAILGGNPDGPQTKRVVSQVPAPEAVSGRGDAEDVPGIVCSQAADSVQDAPVDVPAQAGTESV